MLNLSICLCLVLHFMVFVYCAGQTHGSASKSHLSSQFTPSSLALYPLDFQASVPIPVDVKVSVSESGPLDLIKSLEELQEAKEVYRKARLDGLVQKYNRRFHRYYQGFKELEMTMDLENLPLANLKLVNARLMRQKQEELWRLKQQQRINVALQKESANLKMQICKGLGTKYEITSHMLPNYVAEKGENSNSASESTSARMQGPVATPSCVLGASSRPLELELDFDDKFSCRIDIKCTWTSAQTSAYFGVAASELQYRVVLVETCKGIVENASTLTIKRPQLLLSKLQYGTRYHVTVHASVGKGPRLVGETIFVYTPSCHGDNGVGARKRATNAPLVNTTGTVINQEKSTSAHQSPRVKHAPTPGAQSSVKPKLDLNNKASNSIPKFYTINVQIGSDEYLKCMYNSDENLQQVANDFVTRYKLKKIIVAGLVEEMKKLLGLGPSTNKCVDVADLIT